MISAPGNNDHAKNGETSRPCAWIGNKALLALAITAMAIDTTRATAGPICGIEYESPMQVQEQVELVKALAGNTTDPLFITYYDSSENTSWAFTTAANPAHPAVICRRMIKKDGQFRIAMDIRCNAVKPVCDELHQSFVRLNKLTTKKMNAQQNSQ